MNDYDYDFGFEDDQQLLQQMEEEQLRELDEMEPLRLPDAMLFDPFDPFDKLRVLRVLREIGHRACRGDRRVHHYFTRLRQKGQSDILWNA